MTIVTALACASAEARQSEREAFIGRHRCAVVAQLKAIHQRGPIATSRDRFVVVALRGKGQRYVQCIFTDRDESMFCEASSGAYWSAGDPILQLSPASVAALHALGYVQAGPKENFSRDISLGRPPDTGLAADLMLAALADAYGARADTPVEITAPRGAPAGTGCEQPTS